jgi:hypothetical protein
MDLREEPEHKRHQAGAGERGGARRSLVIFAVLALLSLLLYLPAFDNGFRDDDYALLYVTTSAHTASDLIAPRPDMAFYRPATWLLFAAEYQAFGMNAGRYIAFNWLLHLVNSLLFMTVLRRAGYGDNVAATAAGLFLVGYGHFGKQVLWACMSGGLLSVTLALVTVLGALALLDPDAEAPAPWLAPSLGVLVFLAPSLHESALIAPAVALILCWKEYGWSAFARKRRLLWVGGAVVWSLVLVAASPIHGTVLEAPGALLGGPVRMVRYVGLMALPLQDSPLLSRINPTLSRAAPVIQLFLGTGILATAAVAARRRGRTIWSLLAWMLVALAPFCLIGMAWHWLELRYVYFASSGFATLVALSLDGRRAVGRFAALIVTIAITVPVTRVLERKYDAAANNEENRSRMEWLDLDE